MEITDAQLIEELNNFVIIMDGGVAEGQCRIFANFYNLLIL